MTPLDLFRVAQTGPLDLWYGMWLFAYVTLLAAALVGAEECVYRLRKGRR